MDQAAPTSRLAWLDFSEHDRRKALDVIDLFRERNTVDELGLGTVRDAVADVLFPGTSTIQTRARYFLFIPWIYQYLEGRRSIEDVARHARQQEIKLIEALKEGGETQGVIGIDAGKALRRFPSSIYWQGLATWGIRIGEESIASYHDRFEKFASVSSDSEDEEAPSKRIMWHPNLPPPPGDFLERSNLNLTGEEAEYLRERLLQVQPGTLLTYLADQGMPSEIQFPWEHPQLADFPESNRSQLAHARLFSVAVHGAALCYNHELSQLLGNDEWTKAYREDLKAWAEALEVEEQALRSWDRVEFWAMVRTRNPRIGNATRIFAETWIELVLGLPQTGRASACDRADVRKLITLRERAIKGPLSRIEHVAPRSRWNGRSGADQLSYRWFRTEVIVNDILRGLGRA